MYIVLFMKSTSFSSIKELKKSDLEDLSKSELRLARNEIYARHGRRFQDQELQDYFDSQEWTGWTLYFIKEYHHSIPEDCHIEYTFIYGIYILYINYNK